MKEEQKKQAQKLLLLEKEPALAIFDELQQINVTLSQINAKEYPEIPEQEPIDIPEIDLTETNNLLQELLQKDNPQQDIDLSGIEDLLKKLLQKESKSEEINVTLEIV